MNQDSPTNGPGGAQVNTHGVATSIVVLGFLVLGLVAAAALIKADTANQRVDDRVESLRAVMDAQLKAANDRAALAEREGRLAEEAAMHLRSTMRAYGISVNPAGRLVGIRDDQDQEEPVEP